ncbi:MAG: hypothetical protein ACPKM0_03985, partial [Pleomorphochaeta sp.]
MLKRYWFLFVSLLVLFISCPLTSVEDGKTSEAINRLVYVPIFNDTVDNTSKSIDFAFTNQSSSIESELHGTMYLPQLSCFKQIQSDNISTDTLTVKIFHKDVIGTYSYDTVKDEATYLYRIDDDGYIEVVVKSDGTFTYKQYLLVDINSFSIDNMYWLCEYDDCKIEYNDSDLANYTLKGHLYYGQLADNLSGEGAIIENYNLGQANVYVHGTDKMVYGFVDPYTVPTSVELTSEESYISDKSPDDVTIDEVANHLSYIENYKYERDYNDYYYFNDYYYDIENDWFYGQLCSADNLLCDDSKTMDADEFLATTGYSFEDLGFSDCDNCVHLLAESTGVDYLLLGEGDITKWEKVDDFYYLEFSVEKDGVYMKIHSFQICDENKDKISNYAD